MSNPEPSLDLRDTPEGVVFAVRAQPKASRARVVGLHGDALKVAVTDPPERGQANRSIEAVIAEWLGVPRGTVSVVVGHASRSKQVRVAGLAAVDVQARLVSES